MKKTDQELSLEVTPKHGGARTGAGRATEKNGALSRFNLMLDEQTVNVFLKAGDGNLSLGARRVAKAAKNSRSGKIPKTDPK